MKKLLKLTLLATFLLVSAIVNAQECPLTWGVRGGINLSNLSADGQTADAKVGFNVGVTGEYALAEAIYLQSALELTTKGAKSGNGDNSSTTNAVYIQLPIHVAYKIDVADNTKVALFAGPYMAYGVGGKSTTKLLGQSTSVNTFESNGLKRFDVGLGGGVGGEFGKIGLTLGYDFGLSNITRAVGTKLRNRNAYLSIGYRF